MDALTMDGLGVDGVRGPAFVKGAGRGGNFPLPLLSSCSGRRSTSSETFFVLGVFETVSKKLLSL